MKARYLLCLLLLLLAATLLLAACQKAPEPQITTDATTTAPTTPVVTTTATTPTPSNPVSSNPIKEARVMNNGAIQITYTDNSKQSLGTLPLREGYNSAFVSHSLNKTTGILTVTLTDAASRNVAAELLSATPNVLTVRLRERNGKLEWTPADSESWQVLCNAKGVSGKLPLQLLAEATEFGKAEAVTGTGVVFAIQNGNLRFRAREWMEGTDFVMDAKLGNSSNKNFNITYLAEISSAAALESTATTPAVGYQSFKGSSDDITPINMNGTYIGANHGTFVIAAIPNSADLTEEDIGSIWETDTMEYVLVRVDAYTKEVGTNLLWFCPYYTSAQTSGKFGYYAISVGQELRHVRGGTPSRRSFTASANSVKAQFYNATNHVFETAFLNGTQEVDIHTNGCYSAEFVDFYEEYDIIYLPTMLEYLIDNVGYNTNDSHCDAKLDDAYLTFRNTYRYHKNGACVVYSSYEFKKDVTIGYIGGVQSIPFSTHYVYVPGTTEYNVPTAHASGTSINIGKNHLADPNTLVSSYFQFTDANGTMGMNLGFNPLYGFGKNEIRKDYILGSNDTNLAFYHTTFKMYPRLIANCSLTAGTDVTCVAYRIPSRILDDDFTAINWYWVGDDIYLSLHTDATVDKTVTVLPEYMNGMTVTVIEGSASFQVNADVIEDGSIAVESNGPGYAIIKLSPAN